MEVIKNWVSGICTVSLMISVLKAILPKNTAGNTMNIISTLLIIVVVVAPIKKMDFNITEFEVSENDRILNEKVEKAVDGTEKLTDDIIEKELCEYICNKTGLGFDDIEIVCDQGEITAVILSCENEDAIKVLESECGINRDMITFREDNENA